MHYIQFHVLVCDALECLNCFVPAGFSIDIIVLLFFQTLPCHVARVQFSLGCAQRAFGTYAGSCSLRERGLVAHEHGVHIRLEKLLRAHSVFAGHYRLMFEGMIRLVPFQVGR
jgi:hypothetical protein